MSRYGITRQWHGAGHILFSFIGTATCPVRREIFERFGQSDHVKARGSWHFSSSPELQARNKAEYVEVISRSRFALCPRGAGPSTLRIWEAMAAGVIPVIIADDLRLPLGIDWNGCSIRIPEGDIGSIPKILSELGAGDYRRLHDGVRTAKAALDANFAFPVLRWLEYADYPVFMSDEERLLIERLLGPDHLVLEWGAGGSTLHFSQLVRRYVSIEHDRGWHGRLRALNPPAELVLKEVDHPGGPGNPAAFHDYIRYPANLGLKFDRILIDGRCRVDCAMQVIESELLAPGGLVFLHDWTRERYRSVLGAYDVVAELDSATPSRNGLAVLAPRQEGLQRITCHEFSRDASHPEWSDSLSFFPSGRYSRKTSGCSGRWRPARRGLIELNWDKWDPELLTEEGDVLPMGPNGGPVIDLAGRLANQYIWLAYALRFGAEALRPNHCDGYLLGDLAHGLGVLPPCSHSRFCSRRWRAAACWPNLLTARPRLLELIVPADLRETEAIALHARLGDKVGNRGYLPFTREFATRALEMMPEGMEVNVFSDSPHLAKCLVEGIRRPMNFMEVRSPREDFLRICSHTHHIIPDSTFSWMASFLSPFRRQAVYHSNPRNEGRLDYPEFRILAPGP